MNQVAKISLIAVGSGALIALSWWGISTIRSNTQRKKEQEASDETQAVLDKSQSISAVGESFPLNVGMKGSAVKQLQDSLIRMKASIPAGATGYFGSQTTSALKSAGYSLPVSQSDFNNITKGFSKSDIASGGIKKNQAVYAKNIQVPVYTKPIASAAYGKGVIQPYEVIGNYIEASTASGWSKVQASGYGLDKYGKRAYINGEVYVKTNQITSTRV